MEALQILKQEFSRLNIDDECIPEIVYTLAKSIPSETIPSRMKIGLAISELMLYVSEFHNNIKHWNGSSIPINSIMFCIAKSGAAKDSSQKAVRKCFEEGYNRINEIRESRIKLLAKYLCEKAGKPENDTNLAEFTLPLNPLFLDISTPEGFIQQLNDLQLLKIGSGYIKSSEIGQDLMSNPNISEIIKHISILYDTGDKEIKALKDRKLTSKEVKGMPVNALFIGSQDNIIYDKDVKRKFRLEFSTKLARRSYLIFCNETPMKKQYNNVEEILYDCRQRDDNALASRNSAYDYIKLFTDKALAKGEDGKYLNIGRDVAIDDEARDLSLLYQKYCEELADEISMQYPLTKLTRTHMYWKALKLAGALAVFDIKGDYCIHVDHMKAAIQINEIFYFDILKFEKELAKEPYELFCSYCDLYAGKDGCHISLHELRKLGFLDGKVTKDTLDTFVKLVSSCDPKCEYKVENNGITYRRVPVSTYTGVSYKECTGTKRERAYNAADGYEYRKVPFTKLVDLLKKDMAYSPVEYLDGKRSNENVKGGTNWAVLDVDKSYITAEEAHEMISDYNHIIVRTSDASNAYRFRVLLKFNKYIEVDSTRWVNLIQAVANDLGLFPDKLAISQIFFSYATSADTILSTFDGEDIDVQKYLDDVIANENKKKTHYTSTVKKQLLDNYSITFERAYQARDGEGRRKLIWAIHYAQDTLGASKEYTVNLIKSINNYWVKPMNEKELNSILKLIK